MKITSVSLPTGLTDRIDDVARASERSRSFVVRKLLERALTAEDRMAALKGIADAGLTTYNAPRERVQNAAELLDTADGDARIESLKRIADANLNSHIRKR